MKQLPESARALVARHDGVATASQLAAWGFTASSARHQVDAGHWQRPYRGVFALRSGSLTWRGRARAALVYAGRDAALSHHSAAYVQKIVATPGRLIELSIPARRTVTLQEGIRIHRRAAMPPSHGGLRAVEAPTTVLDLLASRRSDGDAAVAVLCAAVRAGVSPEAILAAARRCQRLPQRALLHELLGAVEAGIESPLELRYHRDVERRHRLPRARLQVRQQLGGRWIRADRVYVGLGVRIELDGELAHPGGRTDSDVWRDNAVIIASAELTLRYRWRHVVVHPCETAAQVAAALRSRSWTATPHPCHPSCPVAAV